MINPLTEGMCRNIEDAIPNYGLGNKHYDTKEYWEGLPDPVQEFIEILLESLLDTKGELEYSLFDTEEDALLRNDLDEAQADADYWEKEADRLNTDLFNAEDKIVDLGYTIAELESEIADLRSGE